MRTQGFTVYLQDAAAGRPNVVGVIDGGAPGRSLMFCGHTDTVGVEGMSAPFTPTIREGRLYGRGSQDMKAGVAAMVDAARVARERGFAGRLVVAAIVDEEYASLGADHLVKNWSADAAIVTEPTDLNVGIGHKGFVWLEVETCGRAAHGSRPREGRDAILRMGRLLTRLEALDRELQSRQPHPILGPASLHASTIVGGREWSSYPDRCRLQLERRTITGETAASAEAEVAAILAALRSQDADLVGTSKLVFSRSAYETPADHALPRTIIEIASRRGVNSRAVGMSFWTDAAVLGEAGIPSVLFGPGGAGLHSIEEYVNVADVIACRDILADLATTWSTSAT